MALEKAVNAEPIPGYHLIELLGRGGCGEVWKCQAPGGLFKAIKFVEGNFHGVQGANAAHEELRAIEHMKEIRHPFLLSMDRVEIIDGDLVIVTELADRNLMQVLRTCQNTGKQGIPRQELLGYLREAAEVLDMLRREKGLQHLDIKPQNLFLVSKHIKVADFGLVSSLTAQDGSLAKSIQVGAITPLYAAPELFHGQISSHCDQYSLAITFQELLTGTLPYVGNNARQLLLLHTNARPDFSSLTLEDQVILGKALAKDPQQRYQSCMALIDALRGVHDKESHGDDESEHDTVMLNKLQDETDPDVEIRVHSKSTVRIKRPPFCAATKNYHFVDQLLNSPLLERWETENALGQKKILHYLYANGIRHQEQDHAVATISRLQHPVLQPQQVIHSAQGQIVIETDPLDNSLQQYLRRCQARNSQGVPRGELLQLLRIIAEGLDYFYQQSTLQHLGLNPANLLFQDQRFTMAEFGWMQLFWLPACRSAFKRNKRYSAPELLAGHISPHCDQYSLALIYMEMLTGHPPVFRSPSVPSDVTASGGELITPEEAMVLGRACHQKPELRWPTNTAFLDALEAVNGTERTSEEDSFSAMIRKSQKAQAVPSLGLESESHDVTQALRSLLEESKIETQYSESQPVFGNEGKELSQIIRTTMPMGDAKKAILEVFRELKAVPRQQSLDTLVFQFQFPQKVWDQVFRRKPSLRITTHLSQVSPLAAVPIDVQLVVEALHCTSTRARQFLNDVGITILKEIQSALHILANKRNRMRLLWPYPVKVTPLFPSGEQGPAIMTRGKDISVTGIAFYVEEELPTAEVIIELPELQQTSQVTLDATLVRAVSCGDGWYEVGALFRANGLRDSLVQSTVPNSVTT